MFLASPTNFGRPQKNISSFRKLKSNRDNSVLCDVCNLGVILVSRGIINFHFGIQLEYNPIGHICSRKLVTVVQLWYI